MFAKIAVNGPRAHPLDRSLKAAQPGAPGTQAIKWHFTKFLVGRGGDVVRRHGPAVEPSSLERDVLAVLDRRGEEMHGEH